MLIETPEGWIPLRQIADVVSGPNQILREAAIAASWSS